MKRVLIGMWAGLLVWSPVALASAEHMEPYTGSKEFEHMKQWAGSWGGTHQMGDETTPAAAKYQVTSNGSAIVETLFPGTPHEMVTVYHEREGRLTMTHYCGLGNQPVMDLVTATEDEYAFTLSDRAPIDVANEAHMHSLKISFDPSGRMIHRWTFFENGAPKESNEIILSRTS